MAIEKNGKQEWDFFWKKGILQGFIDLTREWSVFYNRKFLLREFMHAGSFCEVGCGSSILLARLPKHMKKIGIDYSAAALKKSKSFLEKNNVKNYSLIMADIKNPGLKSKFGLVYSNGLIEHFEDPGEIIYQHLLLTKKGGAVVIVAPYKYSFKKLWHSVSRIPGLRRVWPWPDQAFFTKKSLEKISSHPEIKSRREVFVQRPTEDVVLVIRK